MIADRALEALKAWIESKSGTYAAVADLTIVLRDTDADKSYPRLTLTDTAAEEHPVLRGVMAPLTVEALLETVPHADGATAGATTQATHQTYTEALYDILGDNAAVSYMDALSGITVWDVRGDEGTTSDEDGRRVTRFEVRITCCNQ